MDVSQQSREQRDRSSRSPKPTREVVKKCVANEELSEAADVGSRGHGENRLPLKPDVRSAAPQRSVALEEDGVFAVGKAAIFETDVVHPETSCGAGAGERETDLCELCGRSRSEGQRLLELEREVEHLEEALRERETIIAALAEENTRKTSELLEVQLQKVFKLQIAFLSKQCSS